MKTIPAPSFWTNHNQLYLVRETETASIFQHGESLRNYLWRERRLMILSINIMAGSGIWEIVRNGLNKIHSEFYFIFLFPGGVIIPIFSFILYLAIKPSFVVWIFDQDTGQLEYFYEYFTFIRKFSQGETCYYNFEEIKSIDVTEHIEEDTISAKYYKLSIVFHNGDKFVMSKSDYTPNKQHQAIRHKHHLELAENMRFRVGLRNPTEYGQRSQDIKVLPIEK